MKATIIPIDPQPKPFVIRLEFDSEQQYALFRQLFTTHCVCQTMIDLGEPELGRLWNGILPNATHIINCKEITKVIKSHITI